MSVFKFALGYSALTAAVVGLLAMFAPATFYGDFPFFTSWVDNLPPYNEHLTTDTGGLYLGFALLLGWALVNPALVVPAGLAFAFAQTLHGAFHLAHLDGYPTADAVSQTLALAALVAAPLLAVATRPRGVMTS